MPLTNEPCKTWCLLAVSSDTAYLATADFVCAALVTPPLPAFAHIRLFRLHLGKGLSRQTAPRQLVTSLQEWADYLFPGVGQEAAATVTAASASVTIGTLDTL